MRSPASTSGSSPPIPEDGYPQRGSVVGDTYRLDAVVGEGPSGVVYNAWHLGEHRAYAAKVLHRDLGALTAALVRLRHDNQAIERLHHPHLGASAALVGQETPLLVRPLSPGESLRARLELGALPLGEVARLFVVLCGALEAAGRHGVVHGDLKPENVLLIDPPGRIGEPAAQVIDFGMCHLRDHEGGVGGLDYRRDASPGAIGYLAPEQIQGDGAALDGRADVFALGALLFECLTGRPAFAGATPAITVAKICLGERPRPSEHAPGLPPALDELFQRACHRQPEGRLPSPRALWTALHAAIGDIDEVREALRAAASPTAAPSTVSLLPGAGAAGAAPGGEGGGEGEGDDAAGAQASGGFSPSTVSLWPSARGRSRRHSGALAIQLFKELEHARAAEARGPASHQPAGVADPEGPGQAAVRPLPSGGSQKLRGTTAERAALLLDSGRFTPLGAHNDDPRAAPRHVSDDEVTGRLHSSQTQPRPAPEGAAPREAGAEADPTGLGALVARRARAAGEPLPPVLGLPGRADAADAPVTDAPAPASATTLGSPAAASAAASATTLGSPASASASAPAAASATTLGSPASASASAPTAASATTLGSPASAPGEAAAATVAPEPRWLRPLPAVVGALLLLLVLLLVLLS